MVVTPGSVIRGTFEGVPLAYLPRNSLPTSIRVVGDVRSAPGPDSP